MVDGAVSDILPTILSMVNISRRTFSYPNVSVHGAALIGQSEWLRNNRLLFFTVLEAGRPKTKAPANSVSGEDSSLIYRCHFLVVLSYEQGKGPH